MRAILVLYMVAPPAQGGLGFDVKRAASIYGTYTMAVYITALPGGLAADYLLGARLAVFLGGLVIAAGHFSMIFHSMTSFYLGMVLIAVGTGLLKPNISAMVGGLYGENDPRRDSGFSIFYMGINIGAVLAPLVCGYLAQSDSFKHVLTNNGFDPNQELALGIWRRRRRDDFGSDYLRTLRQLASARGQPDHEESRGEGQAKSRRIQPLTASDWKRIAAIFIFFVFTILFWAAYEQKGASLNLFAKELVRTEIFGIGFPSSYLQSCTPFFVIMLAPMFSYSLGESQRSSAVEPGQVYSWPAVYRPGLPAHDTCVDVDGSGQDQSDVAGRSLLPGGLRRDVFEPGRTEYRDETFAGETGRAS